MAMKLKTHEQLLMEVNEFIHRGKKKDEYHFQHIKLFKQYALLLNNKLGYRLDTRKLSFIAISHDLFKERSLDINKEGSINWNGHYIPQDLNRYVRTNLDILDEFELGDYFNSAMPLHALAAGIWIYKELKIKDPEILYPIMFHSCPIMEIYETLPVKLQYMIDITLLADKLSSNYLKINLLDVPTKIDLDLVVFGNNGNEFNYSLGLYIARIIASDKNEQTESTEANNYYFKRLSDINPLISQQYILKQLGGNQKWPKRKSLVFKMH